MARHLFPGASHTNQVYTRHQPVGRTLQPGRGLRRRTGRYLPGRRSIDNQLQGQDAGRLSAPIKVPILHRQWGLTGFAR